MASDYEKLREFVFALEIVDTHEHLPPFEKDRPKDVDVLAEYLRHYFSSDLVSAGLSDEALASARDAKKPLMKRWKAVEPFWEAARNTGYGRSLDVAVRELYGIDGVNGKTIGTLNEAFLATFSGGHYERVLKKTARIRISIEDAQSACVARSGDWVDTKYFRAVFRCDDFIAPASKTNLDALAKQTGVTIHTLGDLKHACEVYVDRNVREGAVAIKTGLAYVRPLRFEKATEAEAAEDFARLFGDSNVVWERASRWPLAKLQDHMVHFVCALAEKRALPVQVHTGLQEGNGNFICHAEPSQLSNLFMEYPGVRFDVFHIGYPYQQTLSALAKNFRNVLSTSAGRTSSRRRHPSARSSSTSTRYPRTSSSASAGTTRSSTGWPGTPSSRARTSPGRSRSMSSTAPSASTARASSHG
jgi:hypothetical protein